MTRVTTSATALVPGASVEAVFAYATNPAAAATFFRGLGPIPAIRDICFLPGHRSEIGGLRDVHLADGSTLREEITAFEPPWLHRYRVTGFRTPLSWLSREAVGEWTFTAVNGGAGAGRDQSGAGVRVTWNYAYHLTSPVVWPLAAVIVKGLMRGAMQRALRAIARQRFD